MALHEPPTLIFIFSKLGNFECVVVDDAPTWVMICMYVHYKVDKELLVDDDLL